MAGVTQARRYTDDVQFSAEDATRSDLDFLCRVIESVIEAGATTINLPDTVGYATPDEIVAFFTTVLGRVPNAGRAVFSAHCHDDLGLAVANTLVALQAGVRQVECTINGIGERAGNASLEEIVMATRVRSDRLPFETGIVTPALYATSQMLTALTGEPVQANKAIVGRNAFAHEAGIHQDGMLKDRRTYEIMRPEDVGVPATTLVLGKHSGRHAAAAPAAEPWRGAVAAGARSALSPDDCARRCAEISVRRGTGGADRGAAHREGARTGACCRRPSASPRHGPRRSRLRPRGVDPTVSPGCRALRSRDFSPGG